MTVKIFEMSRSIIIIICLLFSKFGLSQSDSIFKKHFELIQTNDTQFRTEISSDTDDSWIKWKDRAYHFGFDPTKTPMPITVAGILSTPYMIQVRGNQDETNKKRWGFHVFEGYAKDNKSRITLLVNKHIEMNKPVAELYYYGTEYDHSEKSYNWLRVGSDVKKHSFLFSRDKAVFYGSLKLNNVLTLGNISSDELIKVKPKVDADQNAEENNKYVTYKELKDSGDGSIFYDKDHHIVVIKIDGKWMKLMVEPLPKGVHYYF